MSDWPGAKWGFQRPPDSPASDELPLLGYAWIVPVLVFVAWWPSPSYWFSDDFIALHYASDFGRALSDFAGNQYGLEGLVWFYRPVITASFAIETALGASPLASHVVNAVAHAASALLIVLIARRFLPVASSALAGLIWGCMPGHAGAVLWAVGRVDSHTTVWILLSGLLLLRFVEGRQRTRIPALAAATLALMSKESAMVLPGIAFLLGAASRGFTLRERVRAGLRAAWPFFALLAVYFGARLLFLGQLLGGYETGRFDLSTSLTGFAKYVAWISNPLAVNAGTQLPDWVTPLGWVPLALSLCFLIVLKRLWLIAWFALMFIGCALPSLHFWSDSQNLQNLRYFYLPTIALAALIAAGGFVPALLTLAAAVVPLLGVRDDYGAQAVRSRTTHSLLRGTAPDVRVERLFVAGLPRTSPSGRVVAFHLGVDRLLMPPFVEPRVARTVLALRPLAADPAAWRTPYGDERSVPFRGTTTIALTDDGILARLPQPVLPDAPASLAGVHRFDSSSIAGLDAGETESWIVVHGVRAPHYRVTIFTAGGYLSTIVADRAEPGAADGRAATLDVLTARYVSRAPPPGGDAAYVAFALTIATTLDLSPTFPTLVEPGTLVETPLGPRFDATHANHVALELEFGRDFATFMSGR